MKPLLKIRDLTVHYDGMQALHQVDLEVYQGEIVSVLGSNGAGKSTLINTICGLKKMTTGEIYFVDQQIDQIPAHDLVVRGIVQVPEGRRLFPLMTVEENLLLGSYNKEAKKQRKETMDEVYDLLPRLQERRKQVVKTLSGGEQQMVAIGRALMAKPKLLLLDEPSLGLAPLLVKNLFRLIVEISNKGITIVLSEQNVKQTLQIATRSYVLENGAVSLHGTGKALLQNDHIKKVFLGM